MASPRASEPCTTHLAGQDADFCSLADATLLVEGRELPVHSAVLSMHSCWFRGLFASLKDGLAASSSSGELAVEPCEGLEAFCAFLRCLYRPAAAVVKEELVEIREEDGELRGRLKSACGRPERIGIAHDICPRAAQAAAGADTPRSNAVKHLDVRAAVYHAARSRHHTHA